jgi:hypothetical protein
MPRAGAVTGVDAGEEHGEYGGYRPAEPLRVSIEEIARLAGHASTRTTEVVYRRELRPVITTGAEIVDELSGASWSSCRPGSC